MRTSLRNFSTATASILLMGSLVACQANPGPAPVEESPPTTETTTQTTTAEPVPEETEIKAGRAEVNIGIDPLRNGFNPHLSGDDSALVRDIASLVLPSAYTGGQMDTDLLDEVSVLEPAEGMAQTVRYVIAQEAQWSDGTPITGSDFDFLRRSVADTPGTFNRAGYQAIAAIRTSAGGKTVEVDFSEPVAQWQQLFSYLLPSHLIQDISGFRSGLYAAIPASAGRYMVRSIDRQRGVVTLSRNDRFWGERPAEIELLTFHDARSTSRAGEFLRTGQSVFMNLRPTETLVDTFNLLPGTDVRVSDTDRTLELTLNTNSEALSAPAQRAQIFELIDVPLAARLATGRAADLSVAQKMDYQVEGGAGEFTEPLRFAVDPADDSTVAAGRAVVDMLAAAGIEAVTVTMDFKTMLADVLPTGEVDGVITRTRNVSDALSLADRYGCDIALSGWCDPETESYLDQLMAGTVDFDPAWSQQLNSRQALSLPIVHENRVEARTAGIVGPTADVSAWPGGIASASNWRKNETE